MSTALTTPSEKQNPVATLWRNIQLNAFKFWVSTVTGSANAKEAALIKKLEFDIANRKKKFGLDYLTLKLDEEGKDEALKVCLNEAVFDIENLMNEIKEHQLTIDSNKEDLRKKVETAEQ